MINVISQEQIRKYLSKVDLRQTKSTMDLIRNGSYNFYKHIAKLFYAVAFIDGNVRPEEIEAFKQTFREEWLKRYTDKEGISQIFKEFTILHTQERDADESFYEFVGYKREYENLFTNTLRNILWKVSCVIADRVHKKNKSELILLVHLGKELGIVK